MEPKIRIVIAEDESLIRKSLILLLKETPSFEIVGEAANGRSLIDLLKRVETDIVLLDIKMPVMDGAEALKTIRARFPEIKVIVLSFYKDPLYLRSLIAAGANSYLAKDSQPEELVSTIMNVHRNGFYLPESLARGLFGEAGSGLNASAKGKLTNREIEIMRELCDGKTEKEIAQKLNISPHTVHFHRTNIYTKTQSHNLAGLLKYVKETSLAG